MTCKFLGFELQRIAQIQRPVVPQIFQQSPHVKMELRAFSMLWIDPDLLIYHIAALQRLSTVDVCVQEADTSNTQSICARYPMQHRQCTTGTAIVHMRRPINHRNFCTNFHRKLLVSLDTTLSALGTHVLSNSGALCAVAGAQRSD